MRTIQVARLALSAGLVLAALAAPVHPADCMKENVPDQTASGRLSVGQFTDAADRPETAFIIDLDRNVCLDAEDPDYAVESTRRVHIFSSRDGLHARIGKLTGKLVTVTGEPFGAHTAHHHAPIVMDVSEISEKRR